MTRSVPFVRVVVLAFDGASMTLECLDSILRSTWPKDRLEVVVVDNGSLDDSVERIRERFSEVRILEPMANLGFAAGCNLGMHSARCAEGRTLSPFDFVALVNNDATVSPNWLDELIDPFSTGSDIGATSPKMVFAPRFSEVAISGLLSDARQPTGSVVRVCAVRVDGVRSDEYLAFDEGFGRLGIYGRPEDELDVVTHNGGRLRIARQDPEDRSEHVVSLCLDADVPGWVRLETDSDCIEVHISHDRSDEHHGYQWIDCRVGSDVFDVINNAGSELYVGGSAGDRGFLERDTGQFDERAEVFAWCGGAVVLRKEYWDDVGLFDEKFFLYYEDTDVAWRGRLRGWRYIYVPTAVVRHRHGQSSVVGSSLFRFQVDRNRLLVLVKNAPWQMAVQAVIGELRRFWRTLVQDVVLPVIKLKPPRLAEAAIRKNVVVSFFALTPHVLRHRWQFRGRVSRSRVARWAVHKIVPVPSFSPSHIVETTDKSRTTRTSMAGEPAVRPKAAVYNLFWDTYGGGEVVSGEIARLLGATHDVTLLGPREPDAREFVDRLGIDISQCRWAEVNNEHEASQASAEFDVFVNCTYSDRAVNRAPIGLYYVHFPRVLVPRVEKVALQAGIRAVTLAQRLPLKISKFSTAERVFRERLGDDAWVGSYTKFLANSSYTRMWIRRIWNCDSDVVHPPVRARPTVAGNVGSTPAKSRLITSVGRFFDPDHGHSKKQMELLTAFADMARSHAGVGDWRLSLVGGADARSREFVLRLRREAVDLPVDIHVNAPRRVVDENLAQASIYWHAAGYGEDEQTHPERFEHFGISVVEAMAAGAVPLVYGAGGPTEIVRDGVDGFHWHTPEQLARLTRRLINDDRLLEAMSRSAQSRATEFGLDVFDAKLRHILGAMEMSRQTM